MSHASLERQLLTAQTANTELEKKLLQKDLQIEKLERDRRWLSDREKEEREQKDREREAHDEDKVSVHRGLNFFTDWHI
jgi:mitotic spindle assembly checkpoint protein MAD1